MVQSDQSTRATNPPMPSPTSDRVPEASVIVAGGTGPELDGANTEVDTILNGSATLIESPSDAMSLLASPKG